MHFYLQKWLNNRKCSSVRQSVRLSQKPLNLSESSLSKFKNNQIFSHKSYSWKGNVRPSVIKTPQPHVYLIISICHYILCNTFDWNWNTLDHGTSIMRYRTWCYMANCRLPRCRDNVIDPWVWWIVIGLVSASIHHGSLANTVAVMVANTGNMVAMVRWTLAASFANSFGYPGLLIC